MRNLLALSSGNLTRKISFRVPFSSHKSMESEKELQKSGSRISHPPQRMNYFAPQPSFLRSFRVSASQEKGPAPHPHLQVDLIILPSRRKPCSPFVYRLIQVLDSGVN